MMVTEIFKEAVVAVMLLSGVPLIASSVAGLCVSTLQASTQIQEQSVSYLTRLIVIVVVMVVLREWYGGMLIRLFEHYLENIPLWTQSYG